MGSSNPHLYRGGGFAGFEKNQSKDFAYGLNRDAFEPITYGFSTDLTKTDRSGTGRHLPNEVIKIDPSDPACIGVNFRDGIAVTTINNLGAAGGFMTNATSPATLQFPKVYRVGTSLQQNLYTNNFLNFDNTTNNVTSYTLGNTSTCGFLHRPNFSFSIYLVISPRSFWMPSSFGNQSMLFQTSNFSNGTGLAINFGRTIFATQAEDNEFFFGIFCYRGVANSFPWLAYLNDRLNQTSNRVLFHPELKISNINAPIVISILATNTTISGNSVGFIHYNGKKAVEIVYPGIHPYNNSTTSTNTPTFFKLSQQAAGVGGGSTHNYMGGIGDFKIFDIRHDESTHQDIVQMLMKKYKIT